jgi:hypothetical protein
MPTYRNAHRTSESQVARMALLTFCALSLFCANSPSLAAQDAKKSKGSDDGAGIVLKTEANAKEVGLPIYPGAKLHKDAKNESSTANLGLWGGAFGFKLVVMKMESTDAPEKIAAFYQKALAKYGRVLDCSHGDGTDSKDSKKLTCDDDKPEAGKKVFKAGTKEKQHVVAIESNGTGSLFDLVYVEARGGDQETQ